MAGWAGNPSFDLFQLPEEHEELRAAIRALAEKEIAPHAADVDEQSRFPRGGAGGAERVGFQRGARARGVRRSGRRLGGGLHRDRRGRPGRRLGVADPGSQQAGHHGPDPAGLRGAEEAGVAVAGSTGRWRPMRCREREAGSDAAAMRTRAKADGDDWILNGAKCWITNGGKSTWYTVMAVTDPDKGANGISAFIVHKDDEGFTVGPKERKLGIKGSPTTELYFENCRIPGDRIIGEPGTGFKTALATLDHTRPTIGAQAVGIAQGAVDAAIAYTKDRKQFGKSISDFQARAVHARRHGDEGRGRAADGLHRRRPRRTRRAATRLHLGGVEVLRLRRGDGGHHRRRAAVRRRRLHHRLPGRTDDARRQDHPDLRGHQPDSARGDVTRHCCADSPGKRARHRIGSLFTSGEQRQAWLKRYTTARGYDVKDVVLRARTG